MINKYKISKINKELKNGITMNIHICGNTYMKYDFNNLKIENNMVLNNKTILFSIKSAEDNFINTKSFQNRKKLKYSEESYYIKEIKSFLTKCLHKHWKYNINILYL